MWSRVATEIFQLFRWQISSLTVTQYCLDDVDNLERLTDGPNGGDDRDGGQSGDDSDGGQSGDKSKDKDGDGTICAYFCVSSAIQSHLL